MKQRSRVVTATSSARGVNEPSGRQADPCEATSLQNLARIQGIAEAIAQVVDAEHGEEDGGAGEDGPMGREVEIVLGVVEDAAPGRNVRGEAQPEEGQGRFRENGRGYIEGTRHDD